MRLSRGQIVWGLALILIGVLMLAVNTGLIHAQVSFWALMFGGVGLLFLLSYLTNRAAWGLLIPACIFIGLGVIIFLSESGTVPGAVIGAIFLGCIAVPFWGIALVRSQDWWPIIPAGVLTTLAAMPLLSESRLSGEAVGGVFFLGLAGAFALVRLRALSDPRMQWAWYPAAILALMGVLVLAIGQPLIWPVVLIGGGVLLLVRSLAPRRPSL